MFSRSPLVFTVLGLTIVSIILLLIRDFQQPAETAFLNSQALYAEVSTGVNEAFPNIPPSTEKAGVPIVVYHIVRPSYPSDDRQVKALAQTPEVFDAQMKYLADAGYNVISFQALENYFKIGTPLPTKPIIISFDDGWGDQFEYAFPILKKYHYAAIFFVFTNPIGTHGFLTWDNLRTLRDAGMTIGSHTRSHPYLTKIVNPTTLWNEIYESKKVLEKNLGVTIDEFAYPFGKYNATTTAMVKKAGYTSARGDYYYGTDQSKNRLYELSALNAPTTLAEFTQKFPAN